MHARFPLRSALALFPLLAAMPLAQGQSLGTLNCPASNGHTISMSVFGFDFDVDTVGDINNSLIVIAGDFSELGPLLVAQSASTTYPTCVMTNGSQSITLGNASLTSVDAYVYGPGVEGGSMGQAYSEPVFTFSSVTVNGTTVNLPTTPASPEARAHARADLQARLLKKISKPSSAN